MNINASARRMLRLFAKEIESILRRVPALRFCMAASNRTQHKKRAIRTKRFRIKMIPASHNLLKSLRCKNSRNDFAEPPHFVQRVRKILIDGVGALRCAEQDAEPIV